MEIDGELLTAGRPAFQEEICKAGDLAVWSERFDQFCL